MTIFKVGNTVRHKECYWGEPAYYISAGMNGHEKEGFAIMTRLLSRITSLEADKARLSDRVAELERGCVRGVYLSACYCDIVSGHVCTPCAIKKDITMSVLQADSRQLAEAVIKMHQQYTMCGKLKHDVTCAVHSYSGRANTCICEPKVIQCPACATARRVLES